MNFTIGIEGALRARNMNLFELEALRFLYDYIFHVGDYSMLAEQASLRHNRVEIDAFNADMHHL